MKALKIKEVLEINTINEFYTVQGWVRTFRANRFVALNDGSTLDNLQCVIDFESIDESLLKQINTGAALRLKGTLVESQGGGQKVELQVEKVILLGASDPE